MTQHVRTDQGLTLSWFSEPAAEHIVQFRADDATLERCLLEYIHTGLMRHETCIVIATPEKLIRLQKALRKRGIDIGSALTREWYRAYDADELAAPFIIGQVFDEDGFKRSVTHVINSAMSSSRSIRIFGEMVAVLRRQQNMAAVLEVEKKWTELLHDYPFSLYCSYPDSVRLLGNAED